MVCEDVEIDILEVFIDDVGDWVELIKINVARKKRRKSKTTNLENCKKTIGWLWHCWTIPFLC